MSEPQRVLFVCTHNAARSQMAEALLRHAAGDRFEAYSAGLEPTDVHPLTKQVLVERGIDIQGLRAKSVKEFLARETLQYAIIVCSPAEDPCPRIFPFTVHTLYWPFEDPAAPEPSPSIQLTKFRRTRDQIDARIRDWLRTGTVSD